MSFDPVGLISTGVSAAVTSAENRRQRNFSREMFARDNAEYDRRYAQQRADYLSDLASEREYNSASAQARRLREAGINPNGASNPVTAGTTSGAQLQGSLSPNSPIAPAQFNVGSQLQAGIIAASQLDIAQEQNEIARRNADTALFRAYTEARVAAAQNKESASRTVLNDIESKYRDSMLKGHVDEIRSEIDVNRQRSFNLLQDSITKMNLRDAQRNELLAKIDNLNANSDLAYRNMELVNARISESRSHKGLMDEQAQFTFVQREYQEWYNKVQNEMESVIKSIQSSNASKAEKEAAMSAVNAWFDNINSTLRTFLDAIGIFGNARKTGTNSQGYSYTVSEL